MHGAYSCFFGINCLRGWCLAQWAAVSLEAGTPKCTVAGTTRLAGKPPEPP